jgi:hypothetical protein
VLEALKKRHADERARERTAEAFDGWLEALVTQVAAAWLLSCVFVRVLEDRGLIEQARVAGPGATDSQKQFFALAPSLTEREYLLTVFRELSRLPGVAGIFDARQNLVWKLAPSAEATKSLLELFRLPDAEAPAFRFGQGDTRVLGDLYQDLSEAVRKRYALLQTPRFVESFILDRTLERAIERFGLDETDLIDPTCGSGHFLLGAFERLVEHRMRESPGLDPREAARLALDAVYGADINPYAVAIARFRLTLAFIEKAGYRKLADVPELPLHVVVAASLLHNPHAQNQTDFKDLEGQSSAIWAGEEFALEDEGAAREVLYRKYAAVVGNPPYITVKDKVLRERYRAMYSSAFRSYSLAVPFMERFFQLGRDAAFIGQITANSFMKREFGKKLIEEFLPSVNVNLIVNTSGAYIPGHGTPTVLLFGTAEPPQSNAIHTVLAKRGEPSTPDNPEAGEVWAGIARHWSELDFENDYISIAEAERANLAGHPWSLAGGGATEVKQLLEERSSTTLGEVVKEIGYGAVTREDELFSLSADVLTRWRIPTKHWRPLVAGENVRDWAIRDFDIGLWPYDEESREPSQSNEVITALWRWKTQLAGRVAYGKSQAQRGLPWWAYSMFFADRFRTPLSITFAFVATHNHFVLDRGGKVFKQTAPIIKLPETATENDHLALLAYLNSSTAWFWCRQVMSNRGYGADAANARTTAVPWEDFYETSGGLLSKIPIPSPSARCTELARLIDSEAGELNALTNQESLLGSPKPELENKYTRLLYRLVLQQELLDWLVYLQLDLFEDAEESALAPLLEQLANMNAAAAEDIGLPAGSRAFEFDLADESTWHERNDYSPPMATGHERIDRLVSVQREIIAKNKNVRLLESPEFKRRWRILDFTRLIEGAGRVARLSSVEAAICGSTTPMKGRGFDCPRKDIESSSIPFLAQLRFSTSGLAKHLRWQETWAAQREADAGSSADPPIPPKYRSSDYSKSAYYRLRGKLDVPKERFISYPGCESDEDREPVYGWAGWDPLQRAQALATLYQNRKTEEAWPKERLIPLLAGLYELLPWLKQWHNDHPDPTYGVLMGDYYEQFIEGERNALGLTKAEITSWRPPKKTKARTKVSRKVVKP